MDDDRCCRTEAGVRTSEIVRERSYTLCGNIENATRWRHGACLVDAVETLYENFITILHCPALFLDGWKNQWWPVLKFTYFISNCTIFRQEANYRKTKFQPRDQRLNEKLEYKLTCFVHSNIIITEKGHTRGTWSHRVDGSCGAKARQHSGGTRWFVSAEYLCASSHLSIGTLMSIFIYTLKALTETVNRETGLDYLPMDRLERACLKSWHSCVLGYLWYGARALDPIA